MANEGDCNGNNTAIIVTVVVVVVLVLIVAVVVTVLLVGGNKKGNNVVVNCGSRGIPAQQTLGHANQYTTAVGLNDKNNSIPPPVMNVDDMFKATNDKGEFAEVGGQSGIMYDNPDIMAKRWDPEKNLPPRGPSTRPPESMGAQFGPSETEIDMYLPSPEEILASKGQVTGPKYIRRGPRTNRGGDWMRPLLLPEGYDDYDKTKRSNRPRIDQHYFSEEIEQQNRIFGEGRSGVVKYDPDAANMLKGI